MHGTGYNLALVDDHELVRAGFASIMAHWAHGRVVLQAGDGVEYAQLVPSAPPIHLAVLDLRMPRRDGVATARWIRQHTPHTRVLGLSFDPTWQDEALLLEAGARGVLSKNIQQHQLFAALHLVLQGGLYRNPGIERPTRTAHLTPREQELARVLCTPAEPTREQAADALGCTTKTVDNHTHNLYRKLQVHSRTGLLHRCVQLGVVPCPCGGLKGYREE